MTTIRIYDTEAEKIESLCDDYGVSEAELVEAFISIVESDEVTLSEWL